MTRGGGAVRRQGGERVKMPREEQARLRNVYWIGGGSGAGKSTIARRLAAEYGFSVYATDDVMSEHARRCLPEDCPELRRFQAMDMDERWVRRSPEEMLNTFHWYRGEGFGLIVEDLLRMPVEGAVIVEGFRLLPHLVEPLLTDRTRAVWLLPTPAFRLAAIGSRGTAGDIPNRTGDPDRAQRNLLERDRMFTDRLGEEVRCGGLQNIEVDSGMRENELVECVARMWRL
jgi:AAA domain-containing protein